MVALRSGARPVKGSVTPTIDRNILAPLSTRARIAVFLWSLLAVALIGIIDYFSGPFVSLTVLYLVPILVVTWLLDLVPGILFAVLCTAVGLLSAIANGTLAPTIPTIIWTGIGSLTVYLFITFVVVAFRALLEREVELAQTDPLTGAANRRAFSDRTGLELNRSRRNKEPLTIAYIDVDQFKSINDRFGHSGGDRLLRLITMTIRQNLRASDMVARLGGDEFALLLPSAGFEPSELVLRRVQDALNTAMRDENWPATFSAGVITFLEPPDSVDMLIHLADQVMYTAKNGGKNTMLHTVWRAIEERNA